VSECCIDGVEHPEHYCGSKQICAYPANNDKKPKRGLFYQKEEEENGEKAEGCVAICLTGYHTTICLLVFQSHDAGERGRKRAFFVRFIRKKEDLAICLTGYQLM